VPKALPAGAQRARQRVATRRAPARALGTCNLDTAPKIQLKDAPLYAAWGQDTGRAPAELHSVT
jgi:hypothetical protein